MILCEGKVVIKMEEVFCQKILEKIYKNSLNQSSPQKNILTVPTKQTMGIYFLNILGNQTKYSPRSEACKSTLTVNVFVGEVQILDFAEASNGL